MPTYHEPTVIALGAVELNTNGLPWGSISESAPVGHPTFTKTTHHVLDL
jgi:hypothetical protein